jgi:methionine-gamma-lyase
MRLETLLVRGPEAPEGLSHITPLDLSTTYRTPDPEIGGQSLGELAEGRAGAPNPVYARLFNPNVREFEIRMTALERGADSVAFATGMAAITAVLLEAKQRGGHIVAIAPLYGGTHHLLETGVLGTSVTWATPETVEGSLRPDTSLVIAETPSNPTLTLVDIERIVRAARGVPVAIDSTFATPILQQPIRRGAAYVIHSATKFLGGHGDAMGGVVATRDMGASERLRQLRILTGGTLHPLGAHLLTRGLQTLGLRVDAQQRNAREIVTRLTAHGDVEALYFPGLDPASADTFRRQMSGPGSVFSLRLYGGAERADQFIRHLRIAVPAVSLGSTDTLVQRPAALTHRVIGEEGRSRASIPDDLVRISVGGEHVEDLWEDIARAIEQSRPARCDADPDTIRVPVAALV